MATWSNSFPRDSEYAYAGAGRIRDFKVDFRERVDRFCPIGIIEEWPAETAPTGWLECDGSSLAVSLYYDLWSVIGYRFGGSGTNFNLPDCRGVFPRSRDNGAGRDLDVYNHGPYTCTGNISGTTISGVASMSGSPRIGLGINGTGVTPGTTITAIAYNSYGDITGFTLSASATTGSGISLTIGCFGNVSGSSITGIYGLLTYPRTYSVVSGTGIPSDTNITAFGGSGDVPTSFTLSASAATGSNIALTIDSDRIGTLQNDENKCHTHTMNGSSGILSTPLYFSFNDTSSTGGTEFRPKNKTTMFGIRYLPFSTTGIFTNDWDESIPLDDSTSGDSEAGKVDDVIRDLMVDMRERFLAFCPVGIMIKWPYDVVPDGFMECDGASLLRSDYADLFSVIGTTYGTADGNHFNIPDHRGYFSRGWNHGKASGLYDPDAATRTAVTKTGATMTAGDHVGTEQEDAFFAHTHPYWKWVYPSGSGGSYHVPSQTGYGDTYHTKNTELSGGSESRPKNAYLKYIIRVSSIDINGAYTRDWDETMPVDATMMGSVPRFIRMRRVDSKERFENFFPCGRVSWWPAETAPTGWLECDGSTVSISAYPDLYNWIGDTYGPGNNDGLTFSLPDLRGYFIRAQDSGAGVDEDRSSRSDRGDGASGDVAGSLQDDENEEHLHKYTTSGLYLAMYGGVAGTACWHVGGTGQTDPRPSRTVDGRPKNIYFTAIIQAQGV